VHWIRDPAHIHHANLPLITGVRDARNTDDPERRVVALTPAAGGTKQQTRTSFHLPITQVFLFFGFWLTPWHTVRTGG